MSEGLWTTAVLSSKTVGDARVARPYLIDQYSRLLYSTDASMYQMEPIGVVIPRHAGDVQAVLELANRESVAVLPGGAAPRSPARR